MTIWKFPLAITDVQWVEMPKGSKPLSIQVQHEKPCLWMLVDPEASRLAMEIRMYGTGHPIDDTGISSGIFLGTFQVRRDPPLVFHAFMV